MIYLSVCVEIRKDDLWIMYYILSSASCQGSSILASLVALYRKLGSMPSLGKCFPSVPLPVRAPAFSPHWSPSTGNWAACPAWVSVRPLFRFLSGLQHSRLTGRPLQETGRHAQPG